MQTENLERPNYFGIIPASVRYSDVTANAKLLYAEITALCNKTGTCWASNKYFADLYGVGVQTVSLWVKQLADAGFISTKINKKAGNRRYIRITDAPITENRNTYYEKDEVSNNTINNKKLNKKKSDTSNSSFGAETNADGEAARFDHADALLQMVIDVINPKEKITADRIRVIRGRMKDYTGQEILASARAFSKSTWHKENKQMSVDNLLAPSKFGRWYAQREDVGTGEGYFEGEKVTIENQDEMVRRRMGGK